MPKSETAYSTRSIYVDQLSAAPPPSAGQASFVPAVTSNSFNRSGEYKPYLPPRVTLWDKFLRWFFNQKKAPMKDFLLVLTTMAALVLLAWSIPSAVSIRGFLFVLLILAAGGTALYFLNRKKRIR